MTAASYCDVQDLKDKLGNYASTDTDDDVRLDSAISAASRQIDNWCGQRFWQDATVTARTFAPDNPRCLDLSDSEGIADSTGLVVKLDLNDAGTYDTTLTTADYLLRPSNAAVLVPAKPYTEIHMTGSNYWFSRSSYGRDLVQITAKWGWPAVPDEVTQACLILAQELFKAPAFGVAGNNDFGLLRVTSGLNRQARMLLEPYRRPAVG